MNRPYLLGRHQVISSSSRPSAPRVCHFDSIWRTALGNLSVRTMKGMRYALKRWRDHTLECRTYWASTFTEDPMHRALYRRCPAQLAHYFGHRALQGKIAAAGAHTAKGMCAKALRLNFPVDDKSVSGWHRELRKHVHNQQNPIAAAVVKHFRYIMESSDNPFLCSVAV